MNKSLILQLDEDVYFHFNQQLPSQYYIGTYQSAVSQWSQFNYKTLLPILSGYQMYQIAIDGWVSGQYCLLE